METSTAHRSANEREPGVAQRLVRFAVPLVLLAAGAIPALATAGSGPTKPALTGSVDIVVKDAVTGLAIPNFKWMVNLDNSHDELPGLPLDGPSVEAPETYSPVIATGDQSNRLGVALEETTEPNRGYLVSVIASDGADLGDADYKIGGAHFTVSPSDVGKDVVVELQPNPLPLATVRVRVFHDNELVNSEDDIPLEEGLAGFHVTLADRVGEVTTDWFGNPVCTEYEDLNDNGRFDFPGDLDAEGNPVPIPGTGGFCASDATGYATIPNMGPDKYEVQVIPPNGTGWIQTTTIEGTPANDAWVEEGHDGFSTEEGFTQAMVWFGYVRACSFGSSSDDCPTNDTAGTATINGRVMSISLDDESGVIQLGNPVARPYVALNNIGGNDEQVYTGRGNPDGTFTIPSVPVGLYQLAMWDAPLDHIINFRTVRVSEEGQVVDLGEIGIPRWFGTIRGYDYLDTGIAEDGTPIPGAEVGRRDCYDDGDGIQYNDVNSCEPGIPGQDNDTRFKDGTIQYAAFANPTGYYEFPEVFELEHFAIAEVGYGRFKQTGATGYQTDPQGNPIGYPSGDYPEGPVNQDLGLASLLQAEVTWGGTTNYIDWGKLPFDTEAGENGGIVGIVFNATTRNELEARLQANEDYEPGVPGAVVNLYAPELDENGNLVYAADGSVSKDHLANTYGGADTWFDSLPTGCIERASVGRDPGQIQPGNLFSDCIELPALLNQIKPGVFDGGYAFEEDCSDPEGPAAKRPYGDTNKDGTQNRFDPNLLVTTCTPLSAGMWVVEVVPPEGYRSVMEEDINVFTGDILQPPEQPAVVPPDCAGPTHTVHVVDDPAEANFDPSDPHGTQGVYNPDFLATESPLAPEGGSPYEGDEMPLCSARVIDLRTGFNANSDFFLFTDSVDQGAAPPRPPSGLGVPAPGRIRGVLLDDLVLELDPASPLYAEKRGIPHAPIGIRDFTGKLITTVYSDANGSWEVLLPSTGTYNCALPAGPCPGMYQVVGNDPGTPQSPNEGWNPNYGTLKLSFDVWPGLTTYADVAILPITGFVQKPGPQFEPPVQCNVPATTPDLHFVSTPYGAAGTPVDITGSGFTGATATLDGTAVGTVVHSDTSITATIPGSTTPGRHQLQIKKGTLLSPVGITFHVLGTGYNPPQIHVSPSGNDTTGDGSPDAPYKTIQKALDVVQLGDLDGRLILVHPGVYYESLLLSERVKLQGYGPGPGSGATVVDGRFFNFGGISADDFATKIAATPHSGPAVVPMGQVITVLAEDGEFTTGFNAQIDGFKISGGTRVRGNRTAPSQGGGVYAHAFARYLEVSNNLIQSNAGHLGGGVISGQLGTADSQNDAIRIHHNRVLNNGGVSLAGAIGLFNGTQGYEIDRNVICGNYSAEYGGGISNYGYSSGSIHDNEILFNFAFDEGGGVMLAGVQPANVAQVSPGTGGITLERNMIRGNVSNDDGGGVRLLQPVDGRIQIVNNMVVNNLATDAGGGISLDDALDVEIVNNTVARNISTSTAEDAPEGPANPPGRVTLPQGAGLASEHHSQALIDAKGLPANSFSDPVLFNNIFWENEACSLDGELPLLGTDDCESPGLPSAGFIDLEVSGGGAFSQVTKNICTAPSGPNCPTPANIEEDDPLFVTPIETHFSALAFGGDPTFVTVILKSAPGDPPGNYHVAAGSTAVNAGTGSAFSVPAPCVDFDEDGRPNGASWDIGADEQPGAVSKCLFFSTQDSVPIPGVPAQAPPGGGFDNADVYSWNGSSFGRVFDATDAGLANGVNVDGLVVVDSDTFYFSFTGNVTLPGAGTVQNRDIVKYDAGSWSVFFDGDDVSLTAGAENIDAFEILGSGSVVVSTTGNPDVGLPGTEADEDLLQCTGSFGPSTSCTWSYYLDSGDAGVGLAAGSENVDGAAVDSSRIYLTTTGTFSVTGVSGGGEDVFTCNSPTTGIVSACASFTKTFDGSDNGITNNLDAIDRP